MIVDPLIYVNRTQVVDFATARPPATHDLGVIWARLIRKIYTADPLRCPRCGATMRVIAVIDQEEVIYRILSHLNLLSPGDGPRAPPPRGSSAAPATTGRRELIYEPVFEDLPWPESA